ncbi:unnamed protein product [marine sediment metagenome]|uniref:Uncharacterized protein n=1 Tax=marine sediment metagenome TaxID=412755 RepID=X0U5Z1_9ZZZZ
MGRKKKPVELPADYPTEPPKDVLKRTIRIGDIVATSSKQYGVCIARVRGEPRWYKSETRRWEKWLQRVPLTGMVGREGNYMAMEYMTVCVLNDSLEEDITLADALKRLGKAEHG